MWKKRLKSLGTRMTSIVSWILYALLNTLFSVAKSQELLWRAWKTVFLNFFGLSHFQVWQTPFYLLKVLDFQGGQMFVQAPKNKRSKKSLETRALTFKNINLLDFCFHFRFSHVSLFISKNLGSKLCILLILNKLMTK